MDNSADSAKFKEDLLNIARTTLSSKLLNVEKDHFAQLAVDAVLRLKGSGNLDHIQVKGGNKNKLIQHSRICCFLFYFFTVFLCLLFILFKCR